MRRSPTAHELGPCEDSQCEQHQLHAPGGQAAGAGDHLAGGQFDHGRGEQCAGEERDEGGHECGQPAKVQTGAGQPEHRCRDPEGAHDRQEHPRGGSELVGTHLQQADRGAEHPGDQQVGRARPKDKSQSQGEHHVPPSRYWGEDDGAMVRAARSCSRPSTGPRSPRSAASTTLNTWSI